MNQTPILLLATIFTVLLLSLKVWAAFFQRLLRGEPGIPYEPRPPAPWNGWDVLLILIASQGIQLAAAQMVAADAGVEVRELNDLQLIIANVPAGSAIFAVALVWLVCRGARARDLGWNRRTVAEDALLGLHVFVAVVVPVYLIQFLLTLWIPYEHPLVTQLQEQPTPETLLLCLVSAVIVAPIVEEFLFRVVLLNWLRSLEQRGLAFVRPSEAAIPAAPASATSDSASETGPEVQPSPPAAAPPAPRGIFPIVGSALVFALLHLGQGAAPIPLFFLAVALGYVYHRTGRILPCVIVHMLLNGCSLLILWGELTKSN